MNESSRAKAELLAEILSLKQKNRELREAEIRYRLMLESAAEGVLAVELPAQRFCYANPALCEMFGYPEEELLKLGWEDIHPQESLGYILNARERVDRTAALNIPCRRKDASVFYANISTSCLVLGGARCSVSFFTDVTASQKTEENLARSEKKFSTIFHLNPNPVVISELVTGIIINANQSFTQWSGYSTGEVIGTSLQDLNIWVNPPDRGKIITALQESGAVDGLEIMLRQRSGALRRVLLASRFVEFYRERYLLTHIQDVTERVQAEEALRQSEQRFRSFVENATDIIFEMTREGLFNYLSPHWFELMGYPVAETIGRSFENYVHPDDIPMLREVFRRIVDTGETIKSLDHRAFRRDGSLRWFSIKASPLRDEDGGIVSVLGIARDVTEHKLEAEERRNLEQQLFHSQKLDAIGLLAGGVAHDFNNMLSVIIGNAEMTMDRLDRDDPTYKSLQVILNAGLRSAELTHQLLAFARKQNISPQVLDMNEAVSHMLKMLQRLIGENINLAWMPGPNLWRIRIDPSQVDQILANLTVNARDAIREAQNKTGKIIIETVNTFCDEAYCSGMPDCVPGEYVVLAVSDDGCGMKKETLASIFEPFFTTKKDGTGTGLGLSTVYGIVKQNGGFISVYSEPGQGSTFRIYLPSYKAQDTEAAAGAEEGKPPPGTETVLIVEDEEAVLNLSREMLELLGYKVLVARGAGQALRLVREYQAGIDLLLTDVVMPEMNGKDLAEMLLACRPGLKCLYMSGYTADVIARQGVLEEGVKFISKPFSLREIAVKIREALA